MPIPKAKVTLYKKLVDACSGIELKGKNMLYTSANTYMYSQLAKDGALGIRLSKEAGQQFVKDYDAGPFLSYGAVMKEYVRVPDDMQDDIDTLKKYLEMGRDYVCSLKPR